MVCICKPLSFVPGCSTYLHAAPFLRVDNGGGKRCKLLSFVPGCSTYLRAAPFLGRQRGWKCKYENGMMNDAHGCDGMMNENARCIYDKYLHEIGARVS